MVTVWLRQIVFEGDKFITAKVNTQYPLKKLSLPFLEEGGWVLIAMFLKSLSRIQCAWTMPELHRGIIGALKGSKLNCFVDASAASQLPYEFI